MSYSPFFQVLHDEKAPVGYMGRGTHYSVLRAVVWQDEDLKPLKVARLLDFAVIWDEDHDERVINVIEDLYFKGLLPPARFIGERKGSLSVLVPKDLWIGFDTKKWREYCGKIEETAAAFEDPWTTVVDFVGGADHSIIQGIPTHVLTYLENIQNLWRLGVKLTDEYVSPIAIEDAEARRAVSHPAPRHWAEDEQPLAEAEGEIPF
jgi:hypothetical protein